MPAIAIAQPQKSYSESKIAEGTFLASVTAACEHIAPLWPLKHFVAVNPFLGFTDQSFAETCVTLNRVLRTRILMPRSFYASALADGAIEDWALQAALEHHALEGMDISAVKGAVHSAPGNSSNPPAVVATIAETLDRLADGDRQVSLVAFMIDEISHFCAAYFDQGQANWPLPVRDLRPFAAWRTLALHDRNPEVMGIAGFHACVRALPEEPVEAIAAILENLGIPARAHEDYMFRALFDIGGWASYARYIGWDAQLDGHSDDTLIELLAIRLAWGWALFNARPDQKFREAWALAMTDAASMPQDHRLTHTRDLAIDLILQEAYEITYRQRLADRLKKHAHRANTQDMDSRPLVQAAFCIDVRSEIIRRAFETACPEGRTIGFAGFFGFPIEYVPIGQTRGGAQCPVLLKPAFVVCEAVGDASAAEESQVMNLRLLRRRAAKAWKSFKASAVSSFSYVETIGLGYAVKIATDSLGMTRPVPNPNIDGIDRAVIGRIGPRLEARMVAGRMTGFAPEQKLSMAQAVLKAMSLTGPFPRLVLLTGHGSTTVNNPHASGLDCGACGGHTGEANARVAAAILNDPDVRSGLADSGITIPQDCWFLGALHDTTTDDIKIFDEEDVPALLSADLARIKDGLSRAATIARLERSTLLGVNTSRNPGEAVIARSRDWSQTRPEWGLAGNTAFIAAPRSLTRGLDLGGRVFLNSYDHKSDENDRVLELIMTAPMVVASWINLQYFGSTVNNRAFGSGNKVLHNVIGQLGVLEGNAGDLRTGLPLQSVNDGSRFVHEPIRLNVFIAAPQFAIDAVLDRQPSVRALVVNEWIYLHTISDDGKTIFRCIKPGTWE